MKPRGEEEGAGCKRDGWGKVGAEKEGGRGGNFKLMPRGKGKGYTGRKANIFRGLEI